jgi:hypothetical protein
MGGAPTSVPGEMKMSGGYLKDGLEEFEHQVVIFTFKGKLDQQKCKRWNLAINALKQDLGDKMMGVTLAGLDTPDEFKPDANPNP